MPDGNRVHEVDGEGKPWEGLQKVSREEASDGASTPTGALVGEPEHARRPEEADDAKDERRGEWLVDGLSGGDKGEGGKGQKEHQREDRQPEDPTGRLRRKY